MTASDRQRTGVPLRPLLAAVLAAILSPILTLLLSVHLSERNAQEMVRQQSLAAQKAKNEQAYADAARAEESRLRTCDLFRVFLGVYDEAAPTTTAGVKLQEGLLVEYRRLKCVPPK